MFKQLEKKIIGKISAIENKTITPAESNIGVLLNNMKNIDEPCYDDLLKKYKKVLETLHP
jgi:hypothetical protein